MHEWIVCAALVMAPAAYGRDLPAAVSAPLQHRVTVRATDVIYAAGTQSSVAINAQGTVPQGIISIPLGTHAMAITGVTGSISCISLEGCISLNSGTNENDPDGNFAQVTVSSSYGSGSISGITAPGAGYLTGVFLASGGPSGAAPKPLNFSNHIGAAFKIRGPMLDQTFFIGDGRTADGSGDTQVFLVPAGATSLVLGISDGCGYAGYPDCYGDNRGSYTVTYVTLPLGTDAR